MGEPIVSAERPISFGTGLAPCSAHTSGGGSQISGTSAQRVLREHAGVDLVRLRGQGRKPSNSLGIGDQHVPARELEVVVRRARRRMTDCHDGEE
jgi:hypothetical protein